MFVNVCVLSVFHPGDGVQMLPAADFISVSKSAPLFTVLLLLDTLFSDKALIKRQHAETNLLNGPDEAP